MREQVRIFIHLLLMVITFFTTTWAGSEWITGKNVWMEDYSMDDFYEGLNFSVPFLLFLTFHEFGHYITARVNGVSSSLPYYIPLPPFPLSIGTLGAIIRLRSRYISVREHFDIGIAGPLAGFIIALLVLIYGFLTLPPADYIFQLHPEYEAYGPDYADYVYGQEGIIDITIGKNLLFLILENALADPERMPNPHEIMHYPYLFAGFLAMVFTSLNLLPVGQLDGGHVLYGLFGYRIHRVVASAVFMGFMFYAGLGLVNPGLPPDELWWYVAGYGFFLYLSFTGLGMPAQTTLMYTLLVFAAQVGMAWLVPGIKGYHGWLLFGFVLGRLIGVTHPKTDFAEPISQGRKILGWIALLIFILTFTPNPIEVITP
ncbi:MAG: site-2 protease family protein [Cyclobacteriaceae bacterium]|nr:site-2 protease family protein [Cyclobacteriaceae bacterium]